MSALRQIQSIAYRISRAAGDAHALERGPDVYAKRVIRRKLTAAAFRAFGNGR